MEKGNPQFKKGVILAMAGIFKHGERNAELMEQASLVLRHVCEMKFQPYEMSIVRKPVVKLIQRLGKPCVVGSRALFK